MHALHVILGQIKGLKLPNIYSFSKPLKYNSSFRTFVATARNLVTYQSLAIQQVIDAEVQTASLTV